MCSNSWQINKLCFGKQSNEYEYFNIGNDYVQFAAMPGMNLRYTYHITPGMTARGK